MSLAGWSHCARRATTYATTRRTVGAPLLGALLVATVLTGCGPTATARPIHSIGAAQANFTPLPTATPTPDPMIARNAQLGCAPNPPAPLPGVISTAHAGGQVKPAPNEVALTFDDGPTPYSSPGVLTALEQAHVPATVFVEGQYVRQWPELLKREWNDGLAIAVHTWDHPLMSKLSTDQMNHQFRDTLAAIHDTIGQNACVWLWRPPYGDYNKTVLDMAASYGLTTVTWDDSSDDWDRPGVQKIVDNVLSQAHPGAIILMHDGPSFREQTAAAIPGILDGLRARGLTPVTLPTLLADAGYAAPKANS